MPLEPWYVVVTLLSSRVSLAEPPCQTSFADLGIMATVLPLFPCVVSLTSARAASASTVLESVLGILLASRVWSPNARLPLSLPTFTQQVQTTLNFCCSCYYFTLNFQFTLRAEESFLLFFPPCFLLY